MTEGDEGCGQVSGDLMLQGRRVQPRGLGFVMRAVDAFEESSAERCQGHIRALGTSLWPQCGPGLGTRAVCE